MESLSGTMWFSKISRRKIWLILEGLAVSVLATFVLLSLWVRRGDAGLSRKELPLIGGQAAAAQEVPNVKQLWGSFSFVSSQPVYRGRSDSNLIALSYDTDAADPRIVDLLDVLKKHNQKVSFFVTAPFIWNNPAAFQRIIDEGHDVHNHTKSHPKMTDLTDFEICEELGAVEDLAQGYGVSTQPYFRPPYGIYDSRVLMTSAVCGFQGAMWTVDPFDWYPGKTVEEVVSEVMSTIHPGAIILMHCRNEVSAPATEQILTLGREQGYEFVMISELVAEGVD